MYTSNISTRIYILSEKNVTSDFVVVRNVHLCQCVSYFSLKNNPDVLFQHVTGFLST